MVNFAFLERAHLATALVLIPVPGHSGIGGNEAAITLVKRPAVFMGPEWFCEISRFVANQVI